MTDDRIAGKAKNLGGRAQEAYGDVTGDVGSQVRGRLRQAEGAAQDLYGQAKDTAAEAADRARQRASDVEDYVRKTIEQRPYTVAFAALAIGYLLGRLGRSDYR